MAFVVLSAEAQKKVESQAGAANTIKESIKKVCVTRPVHCNDIDLHFIACRG